MEIKIMKSITINIDMDINIDICGGYPSSGSVDLV